jgi:hypothetical protein
MKKIILPIITALSITCAAGQALADTDFTDIKSTNYNWCRDSIESMAQAGYINGYGDGLFGPDDDITKLQGIALFARAMGSTNEANEEVLELAHSQYDSALKSCSLAWGSDELAYMLYRGALNNADLTTYITGDTKNKAMTRGEAAVIITKAMGGELTAQSNSGISLSYLDATQIPSNILQYVQYVTDNGIMNGIDDKFEANGTVTRAQMAVMLARVVEKCDYSFYTGSITALDTDESKVTLSLSTKGVKTYDITDNVNFSIKGAKANAESIACPVAAVAQFSGNELVAVDALSAEADQQLTVVYSGKSQLGSLTQISVKDTATSTTSKTYTCTSDVAVTYAGSPATINSLKAGDALKITLHDGKVTTIVAEEKTVSITGATVSALNITDEGELELTISSSNSAYDGMTYPVSDGVSVKKNSKETEMSEIYVGDKVNLVVKYGVVSSIEATSTYGSVTGTIVSVTIANQSSIVVRVDGKEKTYQIPTNCDITVNQKEGSVYDFRVNDSVTLTTQSEAVTKIQVSTSIINSETNGSLNGVVTAVNTSYGFISVMMDGYDMAIPAYKTANNTTVITSAGKTLDFKSIKVGDTVECRGTTTNGAFVATLIIVTQAD